MELSLARLRLLSIWVPLSLLLITVGAPKVRAQSDGPFGLSMGMSKQTIETLIGSQLKPGKSAHEYTTPKVPRGLDGIEFYGLRILPKSGLCMVQALGVDVQSSSHGVELRTTFDRIVGLLEGSYGKHKRIDFLRRGSIWDEPEDWMMGLLKSERVLQAAWDEGEGSTMKNQVKEILLSAKALRRDTGFLNLQYKFVNDDACAAEAKSLAGNVL